MKLLLTPIFDYQASNDYSESYAVHDLGANYPNATGHLASGESMPVEESGNIIIMTYAYQLASGNSDLADTYSSQLETYAQYLSNNGLYPACALEMAGSLAFLDTRELDELQISDKDSRLVLPPLHQNCHPVSGFVPLMVC